MWNGLCAKICQRQNKLFISDEIPCNRNNPCRNGGTCSGTVLSYQCSCRFGYTGTNCESK